MCLAGDETGLVRVNLGERQVEERNTYSFERVVIRVYTGGWRSLQTTPWSEVVLTDEPVQVKADDAYIAKVYRILMGLEKKRQRLGVGL